MSSYIPRFLSVVSLIFSNSRFMTRRQRTTKHVKINSQNVRTIIETTNIILYFKFYIQTYTSPLKLWYCQKSNTETSS